MDRISTYLFISNWQRLRVGAMFGCPVPHSSSYELVDGDSGSGMECMPLICRKPLHAEASSAPMSPTPRSSMQLMPPYLPGGSRALPSSAAFAPTVNLKDGVRGPCGFPTGTRVKYLGLDFVWTSQHLQSEVLDDRRKVGDPLADDALAEVLDTRFRMEVTRGARTLSETLWRKVKASAESHPGSKCSKLVDSMCKPPPFPVDWEKVRRGQEVYMSKAPAAALALLHLSLVGGFGSPKINKVLESTGYLTSSSARTVRLRLYETMSMVAECMIGGPASLKARGRGLDAVAGVRLLHAYVRSKLLKKGWDVEELGLPINQADMAVTGLSFSCNVVFGCEGLSCAFSDEEREAYVVLWRVICHHIGVLPSNNPHTSFETAVCALESTVLHCISPDETSALAADSVIRGVESGPPFHFSHAFHGCLSRLLMGDPLADSLCLPQPRFKDKVGITVLTVCLSAYCFFASLFPAYFANLNGRTTRKVLDMAMSKLTPRD